MLNFQLMIESEQDIPAALHDALWELGSLRASRKTWARVVEALGVDVYFRYLRRQDGEVQPSLEEAAKAVSVEAVPKEGDGCDRAKIDEWAAGIEFTTPNGVRVEFAPAPIGLVVAIHFGRESFFLATMMLAAFARRVPAAYPLLAEAAAELAAKHK
jgi:hypothetical protein